MSKVLVTEDHLGDIADAIRDMNGTEDTYRPGDMASAIRAIPTGGDVTGVKGDAEEEYRTGDVNLTPENIGLGNVDNTSDEDKPVSTATQEAIDDLYETIIPGVLNAENYTAVMKQWFDYSGAAELQDVSRLCDKWYTLTRTGWNGGTRFYHATTSLASDGTKVGDNEGMTAAPSTNETAGQDDYQDVPLFHCLDCNWYLDGDGKPHITAIEGVCGAFERNNPAKLVGVIQMAGWYKRVEDAENDTFTHMYTDEIGAAGFSPLPEAVDLDGTVRTWVVHAKYAAGEDCGSYSGAVPWTLTASHNSVLTAIRTARGTEYGGKTSADDAFLKLMFFLKYASLTADGILQGCEYYNYQYPVAEQETGVERVILTSAQAANIRVGSTVMVGNPTAFSSGTTLNTNRNQAGMRAKADRKKVTRKETITGGNVAIYIDNGGTTFDTTADTITTTGDAPTYVSTSPWYTGACDGVRGVDGSPTSPTSGAEPAILQGIEYALGAYEIVSDSILKYYKDENDAYHLTVYTCRETENYDTEITEDYTLVGYELDCPGTTAWIAISELGFDPDLPEVWFPSVIGCTSTQRTQDAINILASSTSAYQWLSAGFLSSNISNGGLSVVRANLALTGTDWSVTARLSATGNRGTYAGE